ncbi:MAG: hypothetical protein IT429_22535 [Gemmataceae bacterium]|nr:hypothetical protein [Gemmataceae bacterium]
MNQVHPVVRYLILCEDVQTGPDNPRRVTLAGLINALCSQAHPSYPFLHREICVFLQLTECRGGGAGWVEIHHADDAEIVFRTQTRPLALPSDPLEVVGMTFRLRNLLFRRPGLHWVQFWYNEQPIAQQALVLR